LLLLVAFTLFRPGFWMDLAHDPYRDIPPAELAQALGSVDENSQLRLRIRGEDAVGDAREFALLLPVPSGASGEVRLEQVGRMNYVVGGRVLFDSVAFGSPAADAGLEFDEEVLVVRAPRDRWAKGWMGLPGLLVCGLVVWRRRRRAR